MDFTSAASIKRFVYLLIIIAAVFSVTYYEYIPEPIWLLFAGMFLTPVALTLQLSRRTFILIVSGVLAAGSVAVGGMVAGNIVLTLIFLALVTMFCTMRGLRDDVWAYPMLIVNLIAVLAVYAAADTGVISQRVLAVVLGVMLVVGAQIVLWPFFAGSEYSRVRKITFFHLRSYTGAIFDCLMSSDYPDAVYYYERCLHQEKIKCIDSLVLLGKLERQQGKAPSGFNAAQIQSMFALLVDISQIRRRNSDHTAFALCAPEVVNLEEVIMQIFRACAANNLHLLEQLCEVLQNRILQLDDNLENIVKVAAREPVVFVLFRAALQELYEHIVSAAAQVRAGSAS